MTEAQVGFLYNIAAAISAESDDIKTLLQSYYLMRCKDLTRGYGLPDKYFSSQIRCPNCCIKWKNNTKIKVRSIRLSKRQRHRLKSRKTKESKKEYVRCRKYLLNSNEIERICTFCNQSIISPILKPQREVIKPINIGKNDNPQNIEKEKTKNKLPKPISKITKKAINVYANALDVFSLQNQNNSLVTKEKPQIINNSKRKKDKFAGLCQKAVLASAKLGKEGKQNKLSLFLKPSS